MDNYEVMLMKRAEKEIEGIYKYISQTLMEKEIAKHVVDALIEAIEGLSYMPYRYPARRFGAFSGNGYRHLHAKSYLIVYRVSEKNKKVYIVSVSHSARDF